MRGALVILLAVVAGMAVPATASGGTTFHQKTIIPDIKLRGTGGWKIHVGFDDPRNRIIAIRADRGIFHGEYGVRVALTDRGFATRQMGVFGRIDVRLVGARSTKLPVSRAPGQSRCTSGSRATRLTGTYVGTIRFRADGGYTSVSVTRARGVHWLVPPRTCAPEPDPDDSGEGPEVIGHGIGGGDGDLAYTFSGQRLVENAVRSEFRFELGDTPGRVSVSRTIDRGTGPPGLIDVAYKRSPNNDCTLIDHLTLTPPAPFRGSGTLRQEYVGLTKVSERWYCVVRFKWTGDLALRWPGLPPLHLGSGVQPDVEGNIPLS